MSPAAAEVLWVLVAAAIWAAGRDARPASCLDTPAAAPQWGVAPRRVAATVAACLFGEGAGRWHLSTAGALHPVVDYGGDWGAAVITSAAAVADDAGGDRGFDRHGSRVCREARRGGR